MANLTSLWRSTNFLSQSIGTIFFSINHGGRWGIVKLHSFVEYKAKRSRKGKMVFYPGKPAATMENKESVGRRAEKGKDSRRFRGPRGSYK